MKTALITGGAKRIGAAIARDLAEHGYDLALQYVSSDTEGQTLAEELRALDVKVSLLQADLTQADECAGLFEAAKSEVGTIGVLINNASIFEADDVTEFDEALFDRHFSIHLKAPSILSAALAAQTELEDGLIINMIDQRVLRLNPNFYSYTLSKSALWTATRTLAQSLAPRVRVNAIGPGPTLQNQRQKPEDFQKQVDGLLLKRTPELSEFGATIRHLHENRSITGQMLALDGGQHLAWETPDILGIPE